MIFIFRLTGDANRATLVTLHLWNLLNYMMLF